MATPDRSSTRHSVVLRCEWSDRDGGSVVVISYEAFEGATIYARTCDAWCFSAHVHKGAERAIEALLDARTLPFQQPLID